MPITNEKTGGNNKTEKEKTLTNPKHNVVRNGNAYWRVSFFYYFLGWGETEPTWFVGHYLSYLTSPG
jgi:hypothetical protein